MDDSFQTQSCVGYFCEKVYEAMTSEHTAKKRCVVKKLDFENCIVTNIRTRARGRRKLRARVTREVEIIEPLASPPKSPVLTQKRRKLLPKIGSPVLIGKQSKRKNITESPVDTVTPTQSSPVFKLRNLSQSLTKVERRLDLNESSSESTEIRNVEISSVESEIVKDSGDYSVGESSFEKLKDSGSFSPEELDFNKITNSVESKKNYKKNSLSGRLQKVLRKQASEKLLWQHQRHKTEGSKKLSVQEIWKDESRYVLKCQDPDLKISYLFIDPQWVPNVKKAKEGSVLLVHPPWQSLCFGNPSKLVLLNIICLEILKEAFEPVKEKWRLEIVPPTEFENDPKLFVEALTSSNCCFLY